MQNAIYDTPFSEILEKMVKHLHVASVFFPLPLPVLLKYNEMIPDCKLQSQFSMFVKIGKHLY